ncbi:MAG TPA: hypothetical protein QF753_13200 [Victivallales bacterium]|nr:hypothetical protein [Victivallales bacterium]
MKYKKYGASYHLVINNTKNLLEILNLHPSLWISTSAPLYSFTLDNTFLNYIDTDGNKRIISSEVKSSIQWLTKNLCTYEGIDNASDFFKLEWLSKDNEDCKSIINTVNNILKITDNSAEINLEQIQTVKADVEKNPVSESGVATIDAAEEEEIADFMQLVINVTGGELHPSNAKGVSLKCLDSFNKNLADYLDWYKLFIDAKGKNNSDFLPLGESTKELFSLYQKLKNKVAEYFILCKTYAFSQKVTDKLQLLSDTEIEQISWNDADKLQSFLLTLPLAYPNKTYSIDINKDFTNPLYSHDLDSFIKLVLDLKLDTDENILNEAKWLKISSILSKYEEWFGKNPCTELDKLDYNLLQEYTNEKFITNVEKIIARCDDTARQLNNIRLVEKLVLFQRYLIEFVNNFVSFPTLYDPEEKALFEEGSLIIDGRQMNLCINVENKAKHIQIAKNSNLYILYVQVNTSLKTSFTVAVPVTNGIKGNLSIGKRGVFIDINKNVSDAIIVDMIENPISLRETLIYPFKKICSTFTSKFDSMNKDADKTFGQMTSDTLEGKSVLKDKTLKNKSTLGGFNPATLVMGGGVAIAALGSSITYIATQLATVSFYKIIIALAAIIIILMAPAIISSYIKLKRRDLSSILEGSGWAINAKMTLTRRLCKLFTQNPKWPKRSKRKWGS